MSEKEVDYSTIRIKNDIRKELDSLKIESESYSVVIAKLLEDNKKLQEDKELLANVITNLSISNNAVKLYVEIINFIVNGSSEDKIQELKSYFLDKINIEAIEILEAISISKTVNNAEAVRVIDEFEAVIKDYNENN